MATPQCPDTASPSARASGRCPTEPARAGRAALLLGLAFVGWYLLTASGHFYNVDEEALYLVTEGIVERHSVALPRDAWGTAWPLSTVEVTPPNRPIRSTFAPNLAAACLTHGCIKAWPGAFLALRSRAGTGSV